MTAHHGRSGGIREAPITGSAAPRRRTATVWAFFTGGTSMPRAQLRYSLLSLAVASAVGAPAAFAQQDATPSSDPLEQITVTGTRIRRADYTSPTPTTTVDGEYLRDLGLVSVGDALTQNPTNVSRFQATTT